MGQAAIESDGINVFVVYNGVRIAKRSHSGTPLARARLPLRRKSRPKLLHKSSTSFSPITDAKARGWNKQMTIEERTLLLYDTPSITISHSSKTVWVAVGDYKGERIEVKGSSANTAAKNWLDEAHFRGN